MADNHILYLPPYSPDSNPIERAWWFIGKSITHNRVTESLKLRKQNFGGCALIFKYQTKNY